MRKSWLKACALVLAATGVCEAAVIGSDYREAVLGLAPIGYWELDDTDGTMMSDSSGNNYHAALRDLDALAGIGQSSAHADLGTSYLYSSDVSVYKVSDGTPVNTHGGAFSFALWFKGGTDGSAMVTRGTTRGGGQSIDWEILYHDNSLRFRGRATSNVNLWNLYAGTPDTSVWNFVAATWDGTTNENGVKIYLNGELVGAATATGTDLRTGLDLNIGGSGNQFNWDGALDELAMYDYALTGAQVAALYAAAVPEPASLALMGLGATLLVCRRR